jgi:hypothetical protein
MRNRPPGSRRLAGAASCSWPGPEATTSTGETSSTRHVGLAPALAISGDRLYLAWTGSDSALNLLAGEDHAQAPLTLRERSGNSPSLAATGDGGLVLSWTGTDRRVNLLPVGQGPYLPPETVKTTLEQARSADPPALCCHRGDLVLAWTGTDHRVNILAGAMNAPGPPVRLDGARTMHAPALCSHQGSLIAGWCGTDRRLNLARLS